MLFVKSSPRQEETNLRLTGKKVIALVDDEFEDLELWYPIYRVREEGAEVHLVGPTKGKKYIGKYGVPAEVEYSFEEVHANQYDGILVPGGWAPDKLRRYDKVLQLVKELNAAKKPIGQICHAGWVLISAGILKGVTVTSTPGIRDDMTNAGAIWKDEPVVVDGHIISARRPPDLPPYGKAFVDALISTSK
ncbi:type 1 glutamine amidotransferase domain-containing protein [Paenibacillus segetis]|uniref:type 1 glutamine amidotransferase domain-containing protein n=1 Tax=Paenibacillus segetis TaxID=1325360 RepID=UPI00166830F3|nr:type 1 glutamine amidotransferase domain-containing protein [Paenibacillus segetis]